MKHLKKIMSLILTAIMVIAMCVPVMADAATTNTFTITAPDNGHTYEVYQIFTGTLTKDAQNNEVLSNIKWGKNGTGKLGETVEDSVIKALEGVNVAGKTDSDKLAVITTFAKLESKNKFGKVSNVAALNDVPAGYYLIKDIDGSLKDQDDAYTKYIVEIVDDIRITPKSDKPSVEKKVYENVKYHGNNDNQSYGLGYNDTADYTIGDSVPFELIGTVPDMSQYKTYKYTFYDTLSSSFDNVGVDKIKVYLAEEKNGKNSKDITSKFTITSSDNKITVSTNNLKLISEATKGKYIIVKYSAILNASASVGQGTPGNINEVYLKYSNNPNQGGEGEEGKTPEDKVIVFTYELDTKKIDGKSKDVLQGVTFKLYKKDGTNNLWAKVDSSTSKIKEWIPNEADASTLTSDPTGYFKVIGLDDGTYYLKEVQELSGYNKINDVEVVISANTNNGDSGNGAVTELGSLDVTANGTAGKTNVSDGTAEITIANNKGSQLPETGGIGTTIFYVVGVVLMLGAGVLLITKRRMSAKH